MTIKFAVEDWKLEAACRTGYPHDAWFPDSGSGRAAKRICRSCPVRRRCGWDGASRGERWAIVAGFSCSDPVQRASLARWVGLPYPDATAAVCGRCGIDFETRDKATLCRDCRGRVDIAPVQAHIRALRDAGKSQAEIAVEGSVADSTIFILSRTDCRWRTIAQDKAERILAIPMPPGIEVSA